MEPVKLQKPDWALFRAFYSCQKYALVYMSIKRSIRAGRASGTSRPAADPLVLKKYLLGYLGLSVLNFLNFFAL